MTSFGILCIILVLCNMANALYSAKSAVVDVNDKNFASEVTKHDGVVIVEFYAPWCGHCKSLVPEYEKAASHLKGVVKLVGIDATESQSLAQKFSVQGFPTIKVFGADKRKPTDYQGERTADAIVTQAMKETNKLVKDRKSGNSKSSSSSSGSEKPKRTGSGSGGSKAAVVTLDETNFDALVVEGGEHWLVEFYAPWCGHCKNLAPEWEEAAKQLKGSGVRLGAIDATQNERLASEFGVKGYPTIKLFSAGRKNKNKAQDYNGPREAKGIVEYALQTLDAAGVPPAMHEITSQKLFTEKCAESICVVMFVPHILDSGAKGREGYLSMLADVAKSMRGKPLSFMWTEAGAQGALEDSLDVNTNYPTISVLSVEKKASATMRISWSAKNLKSFVGGVIAGTEKILPLRGNVPDVATVTKWDGKDGELPVEEPLDLDDL